MNERLPKSNEGEAILPTDVVGMELKLYRFSHDSVHVSRLIGKDTSVV
jgi:hypothetical protein